jgi:hypothetical protein
MSVYSMPAGAASSSGVSLTTGVSDSDELATPATTSVAVVSRSIGLLTGKSISSSRGFSLRDGMPMMSLLSSFGFSGMTSKPKISKITIWMTALISQAGTTIISGRLPIFSRCSISSRAELGRLDFFRSLAL